MHAFSALQFIFEILMLNQNQRDYEENEMKRISWMWKGLNLKNKNDFLA